MEIKFYRCKHCGNIAYMVEDKKVVPHCCNEPMQLLKANEVDAAVEKHIPVINEIDNHYEIQVGSTLHPMTEEHLIEWICIERENGVCFKYLKANEEPKANFCIGKNKIKTIYAYCNLHGLWKKDM